MSSRVPFMSAGILAALLLLAFAPDVLAEASSVDDIDLLAIFRDNPDQIGSGLISGIPVPAIYADYLKAVTARVPQNELAEFKNDFLADLPPCIDVNESVPENKTLSGLILQDKKRAVSLILTALTKFSERSKWSILRACGTLGATELDATLAAIARTDTNPTDRAFAFKAIAQRQQKDAAAILQDGLFDSQLSIRLLCMELLGASGEKVGCVMAMMPSRPRNPFHYYFLDTALKRVMPQIDGPTLFKQPFSLRLGAFAGAAPDATREFVELAEKHASQPYAAMVLYLCGDDAASNRARDTLLKLLLSYGKKTTDHRSAEFQIQSDLVDVFQQSGPEQFAELHKLFKTNLREFSEEREALLTTLAYALSVSTIPDLGDDLIRVRDMQTKNKDLLMGAAQALAHMKNPQAIPSLIQIMSLKSDVYSMVAVQTLEKLTGIETPGVPRPEADGKYKSDAKLNMAEAYDFWRNWIQKQDHDLQFDVESQKVK